MKFSSLTGEIMILKTDQKQAWQCYTGSLRVAPYHPTREHDSPYPITGGGTQVMSVNEGSPIRALTIYEASLDGIFDVDPHVDTADRGPKLIEELIKYVAQQRPHHPWTQSNSWCPTQEREPIRMVAIWNVGYPFQHYMPQAFHLSPGQTSITKEEEDGIRAR